MPTIEEEIARIEEELKKTQYNKATEHHVGKLKAKLAKLQKAKEERRRGGGGTGFFIKKGVYPSVALIGPPSVGKSSLLNAITNAESRVGDFDFTTLSIVPGIMEYNKMKFRILDLPGIIEGAGSGRGRGREVISVLRNVDLVAIVLDPFKFNYEYIINEIRNMGIRLNEEPPKISIIKKDRGGLNIMTTGKVQVDTDLFTIIAREVGLINADIIIRENMDSERFIDGLMGNRVYLKAIFILNKADTPEFKDAYEYLKSRGIDPIPVSAANHENLESLKKAIAENTSMIRVYLKKEYENEPDEEPMAIREGSTVEDVCRMLHKDFVERFKFATVKGKSVKFPNQRVGLDHVLADGDILTIYIKKG